MATISIAPKATLLPGHDVIEAEVFIAAPAARIFQALTDPRQSAQWWGQNDRYHCKEFDMDVRAGGKWSSKGSSAKMGDFEVHGEYLELSPPRRLVYTWSSSWMPRATVVTWELSKLEGGTLVKVTHSGFAGDAEQANNHSTGWAMVLGWLQSYAEKGETVESRG